MKLGSMLIAGGLLVGLAVAGGAGGSPPASLITIDRGGQAPITQANLSSLPPNAAIRLAANPQIPNYTGASSVRVRDLPAFIAQQQLLGYQKQFKSLRVKYLDPFNEPMWKLRDLIAGQIRSGYGGTALTQDYRNRLAAMEAQKNSVYSTILAPVQAQIDAARKAVYAAR